jgi:hypothetical protein
MLLGCAWAPVGARGQGDDAPPEVSAELPDARLQGRGRLSWFGLPIYDARLWVGARFDAGRYDELPLALELVYARTLRGREIAERSLAEMERLGTITAPQGERWLAAMRQSFPDVARGDRITGMQHPGRAARFYVNGTLGGEVRDAAFARRFFAIWLAPQTSEPALRQALLGAAGGGS